jgi:hypothetical protein
VILCVLGMDGMDPADIGIGLLFTLVTYSIYNAHRYIVHVSSNQSKRMSKTIFPY